MSVTRELVGGPRCGDKVQVPESQEAYVIAPGPIDSWEKLTRRGTYLLNCRHGWCFFEWEGVDVSQDRREPPAWYCRQCVAIVTTLEEKSLHERLHGHTMEIPGP